MHHRRALNIYSINRMNKWMCVCVHHSVYIEYESLPKRKKNKIVKKNWWGVMVVKATFVLLRVMLLFLIYIYICVYELATCHWELYTMSSGWKKMRKWLVCTPFVRRPSVYKYLYHDLEWACLAIIGCIYSSLLSISFFPYCSLFHLICAIGCAGEIFYWE